MNKKERRLAMATALQSAAVDTIVVEDFAGKFEEVKTKLLLEKLANVGVGEVRDRKSQAGSSKGWAWGGLVVTIGFPWRRGSGRDGGGDVLQLVQAILSCCTYTYAHRKEKHMSAHFAKFSISPCPQDEKVLLILAEDNARVMLSARNVQRVAINLATAVQVYDVCNADKIVIEKSALAFINDFFGAGGEEESASEESASEEAEA
jgi:hypothetical protein